MNLLNFVGGRNVMTEVVLRKLGITCKYVGYQQIIQAIELAMENEERLHAVGEEIYKVIGMRNNRSRSSVERNIRTLVWVAWECNKPFLDEIAGYNLIEPPTISDFISIIYSYVKENKEK